MDIVAKADGFRLGVDPTPDDVNEANWIIDRMTAEIEGLRARTTWYRIDDPDNPPPKTDESEMLTKPFLAICPDKDAPDGYDINICWWEPRMNSRGGCWWGDGDFRLYPTHWMPLPTPLEVK